MGWDGGPLQRKTPTASTGGGVSVWRHAIRRFRRPDVPLNPFLPLPGRPPLARLPSARGLKERAGETIKGARKKGNDEVEASDGRLLSRGGGGMGVERHARQTEREENSRNETPFPTHTFASSQRPAAAAAPAGVASAKETV